MLWAEKRAFLQVMQEQYLQLCYDAMPEDDQSRTVSVVYGNFADGVDDWSRRLSDHDLKKHQAARESCCFCIGQFPRSGMYFYASAAVRIELHGVLGEFLMHKRVAQRWVVDVESRMAPMTFRGRGLYLPSVCHECEQQFMDWCRRCLEFASVWRPGKNAVRPINLLRGQICVELVEWTPLGRHLASIVQHYLWTEEAVKAVKSAVETQVAGEVDANNDDADPDAEMQDD